MAFKDINKVVSDDNLMYYPDCIMPFTVYYDASYEWLGAVISKNHKPVTFFSKMFSKLQLKYTEYDNELLSIIEFLNQFQQTLFGNEISILYIIKIIVC